jgi:hypothetical protein
MLRAKEMFPHAILGPLAVGSSAQLNSVN